MVTSFEPELARLRFWNRLGMLALLAGLPTMITLTLCARFIPLAPVLVGLVFFATIVTILTAHIKIWKFRCPDCGQPFNYKHARGPQHRGRKCAHCGLDAYHD
ncbi:MAG: hypothetical protein V4484_00960 [Pseudomonadota bacterium]